MPKDIIVYHDNPQTLKDQLTLVASKIKRRASRITYGRPPHLLDVANLTNVVWNDISSKSLKNYFKKADIISKFQDDVDVGYDNDETTNEIVLMLSNCSILNGSSNNDICRETEQCLKDDCDDSMLFKDTLIEKIEQGTNEVVLQKPALESNDSEFETHLDKVQFEQHNVIVKTAT